MDYTPQVQDHFLHPRNLGEIENPSGFGKVGNVTCGDIMLITLRVEDDLIKDIRFKTFGCAAAIATASVTTELALGLTLDQAEQITFEQVVEQLGGLPQPKLHCSALAITTLRAAIANTRGQGGGDLTQADEKCLPNCPGSPCADCSAHSN